MTWICCFRREDQLHCFSQCSADGLLFHRSYSVLGRTPTYQRRFVVQGLCCNTGFVDDYTCGWQTMYKKLLSVYTRRTLQSLCQIFNHIPQCPYYPVFSIPHQEGLTPLIASMRRPTERQRKRGVTEESLAGVANLLLTCAETNTNIQEPVWVYTTSIVTWLWASIPYLIQSIWPGCSINTLTSILCVRPSITDVTSPVCNVYSGKEATPVTIMRTLVRTPTTTV